MFGMRSGVILVEARVDVADDHGRAPAGDRVRLERVDLSHVPLQRREVVLRGRRVRQVAREASGSSTFATALETATLSIPAPPCIACVNVGESERATTTPISR